MKFKKIYQEQFNQQKVAINKFQNGNKRSNNKFKFLKKSTKLNNFQKFITI